ncbi:tetratricopeptide repeat-containing sensor histidine kinase [Mariniradius saccharolyticus]|uniref:tetratricopeptide repeat-containing sensor histidine kinase n=1 Tax=Mariniradius saccharolyticus TaxID=1245591 RepID=UPI0005917E7C|nr:ATP-binding protein [Mariniradius saccharolyticus]
MKKLLFIPIIILLSLELAAQQHLADSVRLTLQQNLPDTTKAYNLIMLAMYTEPLDLAKAHEIYQEAVDFSLEKKLEYYAGLALFYESTPLELSGKYQKQKENLDRAASYFKQSSHPNAKREEARVFGGLSNYYRNASMLDSAVEASLNSIALLEDLKDYARVSTHCLNLAMIFQQLSLPEKQKEYVDKALDFAKKANHPGNLMLSYLQQASYFTEIRDFQKAKLYADSASVYYSGSFDFTRKQNFFLIKAGTFQNISEFDSAIHYFKQAYENGKEAGSRWNMTEPLMQIGYINFKQKNYAEAEKYVKMGLEIAETDSVLVFMKEGYGTLSDIYAANGNFKGAYTFLTRYNTIKDSLQSEDRKRYALDIEKKYESEKQRNQILQLEAQNANQLAENQKRKLTIWMLVILAVSLGAIILLIIRKNQHKQQLQVQRIKELETEKQLAATEAVLKGEEQERSRLAKDLHDGLGGLLSGIKFSFQTMKGNLILTPENARLFERSLDMLDTSIMEMRRVAHNLMPENLIKFGLDAALKDFCEDINQSGVIDLRYISIGIEGNEIDQTTAVSIYRIIQELVNNILKHAEAKTALVQLTKNSNLILLDVEDDGKGFEHSKMLLGKGIGWSNIKSRLEYLNAKFTLDSAPEKGSSIHIEIQL